MNLLLRDLPTAVHKEIKKGAERHHRSVNQEALALLSQAVAKARARTAFEPIPLKKAIPEDLITRVIRESRDSR